MKNKLILLLGFYYFYRTFFIAALVYTILVMHYTENNMMYHFLNTTSFNIFYCTFKYNFHFCQNNITKKKVLYFRIRK